MLENSPDALSARAITEHLAVEGDLFREDDVLVQWQRVHDKLQKLRRKGIVKSDKVRGSRMTWSMTAQAGGTGPTLSGTLGGGMHELLSDGDWAIIRGSVPASARHEKVQALTRSFIEAVLAERGTQGATRLAPRQRARFLAWHQVGVWSSIASVLGDKLKEADFIELASRLRLLARR